MNITVMLMELGILSLGDVSPNLGVYYPASMTIVLKGGGYKYDVDTTYHEVGHLLHFQLGCVYLAKLGVKPDFAYGQGISKHNPEASLWEEAWAEGFATWCKQKIEDLTFLQKLEFNKWLVEVVKHARALPPGHNPKDRLKWLWWRANQPI